MLAAQQFYSLTPPIKRFVLVNVIIPKLEYVGDLWEGNAKSVKNLDAVEMAAAKVVLGCSKMTSKHNMDSRVWIVPI